MRNLKPFNNFTFLPCFTHRHFCKSPKKRQLILIDSILKSCPVNFIFGFFSGTMPDKGSECPLLPLPCLPSHWLLNRRRRPRLRIPSLIRSRPAVESSARRHPRSQTWKGWPNRPMPAQQRALPTLQVGCDEHTNA